jgi:general nucleoside transport system permease protein
MTPLAFLAQTLRIAMPYLFASAGGVLSERAGIIALGLEGFMLSGAFCAVVGSYMTGSALVGVLCGLAGGALVGWMYSVAAIRYRGDQVVLGIALNLLAVGATRLFLQFAFDSSSNSPRVQGFGGAQTGSGLLASLTNPLVWLGLISLPALWWLLERTPFGLRVRAAGEKPEAAESLGVSVPRIRRIAVILSGMCAALGGIYLALDQHQFTDGMTAGRGFIALAAVIFGKWQPLRVTIACLLFAAAETLQIQLQSLQLIPSQIVAMIPYALTIIALAGMVGRAQPPAALGK